MHATSSGREKNYYEILEIPTTASPDEVYEGYTRAKNAYSQDSLALYSLMSKDECLHLLGLIEEAYTIISDPSKRVAYDKARGINQKFDNNSQRGKNTDLRMFDASQSHRNEISGEEDERSRNANLTKIVAANKYSLNYTKDNEFELLIEQTSEFTGEFLKRIREYKCVPIDRMSEMIKVSKSYITSIEEERIGNLPALVYVRGFVFQYAKCLKLNPDVVATSYLHRVSRLKSKG